MANVFEAQTAVFCWTSLTQKHQSPQIMQLEMIFLDEKTLLWYRYGFLEQLSLTPS